MDEEAHLNLETEECIRVAQKQELKTNYMKGIIENTTPIEIKAESVVEELKRYST